MAYVYLIGAKDMPGRYKIGSTRAKDVNNRLRQLQTGSASELYLKESYETEHPFKLEKMLHNRFKSINPIGEWFDLSEDDVRDFKGICEEKEKIIESLKDNPFYFNLKIIPMKSDFDKKPSNGRVYNKETIMKQVKDMIKKFDDGELMMFDLEHPELYE